MKIVWLVWILIGLFAFALLEFHVITYLIRWQEESKRRGDPRSLWAVPPKEALPVLAEIFWHSVVLLLWLLDFLQPPRRRLLDLLKRPRQGAGGSADPGRAEAPPVLLVHGLGMRGYTMNPLARRLRKRGRTVHLFTYWPPSGSIEQFASQLHEFIEALCRESGCREFDAVGHSLGGLVLRAYLRDHAERKRIRRLVTIGTPHKGSELWRISLLPAGRQLRPDGAFLRSLAEAGPPDGVEVTVVASDFDQLVIPNENARWEIPGAKHHTLSGAGHATTLFHPDTHRIVREALS